MKPCFRYSLSLRVTSVSTKNFEKKWFIDSAYFGMRAILASAFFGNRTIGKLTLIVPVEIDKYLLELIAIAQ